MHLAFAAALLAAQADVATLAPAPIGRPDWTRRPSAKELAETAAPSLIVRHGGGSATIQCSVSGEGLLNGCAVVREDPIAAGFGEVLLKLSPRFRMRRYDLDQKPVEGRPVEVSMRFGSGGSPVPPPPEGALRFSAVKWLETPRRIDLQRAFPANARKRQITGRGVLLCKATADGRLNECAATETPPGEGFGDAALSLAPNYRLGPTIDGREVAEGTLVQIPILFRHQRLSLEVVNATHPKLPDGRVDLDCRVTAEGRLDNCVVETETPSGQGLGDVALRLGARMRFARPPDVFDRVVLPIVFRRTEGTAAPGR